MIITDFADNIKTIKQVIDHLSFDNQKGVNMIPLKFTQSQTISAELKNLAKSIFDETIESQKVDVFG